MLEVRALRCERNSRTLFDALTFSVAAGELLRIEGGNGSGKTTLLRSLCGLYASIEGEIVWDLADFPVYVGHRPGVRDSLSARENLAWLCEVYGQPQSGAALLNRLETVGLLPWADEPCGTLSEGQRKRVNLARLFLLQSPAWILDEPFSAIDVDGVRTLSKAIEDQLEQGGLVILTSHQQVEVSAPTTTLRLGR